MKLYHGTSRKLLSSIQKYGIKRSKHEGWGRSEEHIGWDMTVCALKNLKDAIGVANNFGEDGIVLEIEIPESEILYHPDYGSSPEFDTIHIITDVPPSNIVRVIDAPLKLDASLRRPAGMPLRQWKSDKMKIDSNFSQKLDKALGLN